MDTTETKFKLVFWPTSEYRQVRLEFRRRTWDIISKALQNKKLNLQVSSDVAPQCLGEEEYDARIEYSLKIAGETTNKLLLHMIDFFVNFLAKEANNELACAVQLPHNEFFKAKFCSANLRLATCSFAFLNLVDRLHPFVHGYFKIIRDPYGIMDRVYNKGTIDTPIISDFEHDRRQLVVRFPFSEIQSRRGRDEEVAKYLVSMIVRYKTIRRMLAKVKRNGQGTINLELYFHVSSPPVIRRVRLSEEPVNWLSKLGDRYKSWDLQSKGLHEAINDSPILRIELKLPIEENCQLLNRLSMATGRGIEFRTFSNDFDLPIKQYVQSPLYNEHCKELCKNNFKLMYMIAALLSRGAVAKDYLMTIESERDKFVKRVAKDFERDKKLTLEVLEQTLTEIDKRLDCLNPALVYDWIHTRISRSVETMRQIQNEHVRDGYVRVRKVLITPTRILFAAPELLMGNRVLRKDPEHYPLDRFLRVVFRDDNGSRVHPTHVGPKLIDIFVGDRLRQPIEVAGRQFNYFGSSNSQMRDSGCYFINASLEEIEAFRNKLGSFKIQSAPKMMSRIAQCFTQARETDIALDRKYYATTHDFLGGRDSKEEPYNFSDGVGRISFQTARELSRELKLNGCIPSCFQIRFRGYKGVLSVDRTLDDTREWGTRYAVVDRTDLAKGDCWLDLKIVFRPSQKKFQTVRKGQKLEIVKYSCPVPISLNRPVNNILDQVSALQSQACHRRICDRIHLLMDLHLHSLTRALVDERKAKNKLGEFPKLILYDQITGLNLTEEPFFRSLVRASIQASLRRLRMKLQIPIPSSMGRAMFGVADESGQLQYGQVYVQYTKNCSLKLPGRTAERKVLTGRVMINKNPSIVAGDIRMFEAVDIPALHHLCDVVVFPRYGPRPHTDEMAGSDLDGDEYTVIWDEQLYLDRNEEAFDYTSKATEAPAVDEKELRYKMAAFFVDYIKQDSIGRIANAFLVNSDLYGIASEVCQQIAAKHMAAVDFPKTGVPPEPLSTAWKVGELPTGEEPGREAIPPERTERSPDYMEKNNEPMYVSSRLNGQLFRRAREIDDILASAYQEEESARVECDPLIDWPGCRDPAVLEMARQHYDAYAANIQNILDSYSIAREGELFSGHFVSLRNRLSDKDSDDMSFYNTTNAIEQQLFSVFARFRRQFFETPFEGSARYEDVTTPLLYRSARINGVKDVFKRICSEPTEAYKKLACAYYHISYDSPVRSRLLSFPWLAWDVINVVRRTNAVGPRAQFSFDPLADRISAHMEEYIAHRGKSYRAFMRFIDRPSLAPGDDQGAYLSLRRYCCKYNGLDKLAFFAMKWAEFNGLIANGGPLCELHVSLLLVQFGLSHLSCHAIESSPNWLEMIDPSVDAGVIRVINLERQHGGLGRKLFLFLECLASRHFRLLPFVDFTEAGLGYASVLQPAQLQHIHKVALQTYHQMAFSRRFEFLPGTRDQRERNTVNTVPARECDPFVIEVPASRRAQVHNPALRNKLCEKTRCANIEFRDVPDCKKGNTVRVYVSATGPAHALQSLRELLSVRAPPNLSGDCRHIFAQMAEQLFERLANI